MGSTWLPAFTSKAMCKSRGPARRLGTDIHKLGPQKDLTSETTPRIPGRGPEPKIPRPGAHAQRPNSFDVGVEDAAPRAPMRGSSSEMADHALLRPPERHARAARVRSGSRPVRLNEVAAVDGPQARKTKKFSRKDAVPTKKNWWAIDPWYVRGTPSAEALGEAPYAERAGHPSGMGCPRVDI